MMPRDGSRREFFKKLAQGAAGICAAACPLALMMKSDRAEARRLPLKLHPASHWKPAGKQEVDCLLCPRLCTLRNNERGHCGVRINRGGKLYTLVFGRPCTYHVDPIEKKPIFHYAPGSLAYSIATAGCNMSCTFCQNWNISQFKPEQIPGYDMPPVKVITEAVKTQSRVIAYTYSEPVVFFEYMMATAELGRKYGVDSVVISNGYIKKQPLSELVKVVNAIKVDFKAYSENFYQKYCAGHLKPVLESLVAIKKSGVWLEIVVLIIPSLNDSEQEIKAMSRWIKANLGPDVPVHFTRFHPTYKLRNLPKTPPSTLQRSRKLAQAEGLRFVYAGNVPGDPSESTYCPKCRKMLIRRLGYVVMSNEIRKGRCRYCQEMIPGIWD